MVTAVVVVVVMVAVVDVVVGALHRHDGHDGEYQCAIPVLLPVVVVLQSALLAPLAKAQTCTGRKRYWVNVFHAVQNIGRTMWGHGSGQIVNGRPARAHSINRPNPTISVHTAWCLLLGSEKYQANGMGTC